jgi:hypothetical protein
LCGNPKAKTSSAKKHQEGGSGREEKAHDCASAKKDEDRIGQASFERCKTEETLTESAANLRVQNGSIRENPLRDAVCFKRE